MTIAVFFYNRSSLHVKVAFGHPDENCGMIGWLVLRCNFVPLFTRVQLREQIHPTTFGLVNLIGVGVKPLVQAR
ncbi:hypothetical protein B1R38_05075 [Bacillus cereus]|uniref:hypothetical protein n=1 Tax=Bacillus cereus TaxID=1396 RepID=UPI000D650220|nr:hypothetical protein [Bacillus cereus]PWE74507.1 hypothetical protein B1R38_05075 [Bacillus cereus]